MKKKNVKKPKHTKKEKVFDFSIKRKLFTINFFVIASMLCSIVFILFQQDSILKDFQQYSQDLNFNLLSTELKEPLLSITNYYENLDQLKEDQEIFDAHVDNFLTNLNALKQVEDPYLLERLTLIEECFNNLLMFIDNDIEATTNGLDVVSGASRVYLNNNQILTAITEINTYLSDKNDGLFEELALSIEKSKIQTLFIVLFALVVSGVIITIFSQSITKKISSYQKAMNKMAQFELTDLSQAKKIKTNKKGFEFRDEFFIIEEQLNKLIENLNSIVNQIISTSNDLDHNWNVLDSSVETTYIDLENIKKKIEFISNLINNNAKQYDETLRITTETVDKAFEIQTISDAIKNKTIQAIHRAKDGVLMIEDIHSQNLDIEKSMKETLSISNELKAKSSEIEKILNVIKNISSQTNLLALNATIEAARAGEQGKGFAVVANEINELSKTSSQSVEEITKIIHTMQKEIYSLHTQCNNVSEELNKGMKTTDHSLESFNQITASLIECEEDLGNVFEEINTISSQIQLTSNKISDFAADSKQMNTTATDIETSIHKQYELMGSLKECESNLQESVKDLDSITKKFS